MTTPVIVVHGGAGTYDPSLIAPARVGIREAARVGQAILRDGGSARAAAVAAVRVLEDDPAFNAGRGACLTSQGRYEMDAALMISTGLRTGAVASVPAVRDPIRLAELVLDHTPHALIVGEGATRLAKAHGVGHFGVAEVDTAKARERYEAALAGRITRENRADTVGAVVLDARGELCAACSTGGTLLKLPGRVGDTPLVGSGFYAAPELGACAATGVGEAILAHVLSYSLLRDLRDVAPGAVCGVAQRRCEQVSETRSNAAVGLILIRPDGAVAIAHQSDHMSWAAAIGDGPVRGGIDRHEGPLP